MATQRRFCRFARSVPERGLEPVYTTEVPEGGFCLSAFLAITDVEGRVLMGHLNPDADWVRIGALDASRAKTHSKGWMLPSSHLLLYESPQEAARRVLKEQLGMGLELSGPTTVTEVWSPDRSPGRRHWDFEFIFKGEAPKGSVRSHDAWRELKFIDTRKTPRAEIARSHDDVLVNAGFKF
ncbi:MAG: NUDIX hydrolase [Nitrososphaerota archaeon]|jgi:ADP-ribose pyrophosphatase YjhB (NUDIX family)|nr:NUDIX hydrolase [Nitrososphaerota archaeon]